MWKTSKKIITDDSWLVLSGIIYFIFYIKCFMHIIAEHFKEKMQISHSYFVSQIFTEFSCCLYVLENSMLGKARCFIPCKTAADYNNF